MSRTHFLDQYTRIPIGCLKQPFEGAKVMMNQFWMVTSDSEVLFYKGWSPQCNKDESFTKMMASKKSLDIVFVAIAYVPDLASPMGVGRFESFQEARTRNKRTACN